MGKEFLSANLIEVSIFLRVKCMSLTSEWWFREKQYHCVKSVRTRSYSGPYFSAFEVNTGCGKIRTRGNTDQNNSEHGHFSCSVCSLFRGVRLLECLSIRDFTVFVSFLFSHAWARDHYSISRSTYLLVFVFPKPVLPAWYDG